VSIFKTKTEQKQNKNKTKTEQKQNKNRTKSQQKSKTKQIKTHKNTANFFDFVLFLFCYCFDKWTP